MTALPKTLPAFIWHFMRPHAFWHILLLVVPAAIVLESVVVPYAFKMIVDTISHYSGDRADVFVALAPVLWMVGGAWVTMLLVFRGEEFIQAWLYPKTEAEIRMSMLSYVQAHSHQYFADHFAGSIANKIGDMPRALNALVQKVRWHLITSLSTLLAALIVLTTVSPTIAMILGGWAVVNFSLISYFAKYANEASLTNAEDKSLLNGKIVDMFTNIVSVKLFSRARTEYAYIGGYQEIERKSNRRVLIVMAWLKVLMDPIQCLAAVAIIWALISGWQAEEVSSGDFVFVFMATMNVMIMVWHTTIYMPELYRDIGVARQALSIIHPPHGIQDAPDAGELKVTRGEIEFDGVHFAYVPGRNIFSDKNITIPAGQKVGLVGFSGSGKSTFVNLILRFYDVEQGRIVIDGQDIAQVTQESLRAQIAMIPQDTSLFHRSLRDNIRYGRPEASDAEVEAAAEKAFAHDFITDLPQGYDTEVGERGVKLSGGQRQRIAIARAMLKDAPILMLDEATSSLDSQTEAVIQHSLLQLMQGKTTIVIAHRLSTLSQMDRLLVFKEGEIIEDGSHEELLATGGHYAKLWEMQVGGFLPEK